MLQNYEHENLLEVVHWSIVKTGYLGEKYMLK